MATTAGKFFETHQSMLLRIYVRIIFFLLFFSASHATDISLRIASMDNTPLKEAGAGQPFLLLVTVNNASNTAQYPNLKGIDNLHVRQNGFQMNMVNGTTSITYHYRVRIDTPGTYTLGPAEFKEPGGIIQSQSITVTVANEQKTSEGKKQRAHKSLPTFLRLTCDKDNVVEGEKITCILTFYTQDPQVCLQALNDPDQNNAQTFTVTPKQGPITGNQMINGVDHRFAQWQWHLYPNRAGSYTIPAYAADYITQRSNHIYSMFFGHSETKRIYSNTVSITVDPLPSHAQPISYLGPLTDFSAKINPSSAKIGEGIVLSISITGNGDSKIAFIPLQNLPEGLKWYESKYFNEPSKIDPQQTTHSMEYIIQALKPGDYQIPSQSIHYFDTKDRTYKTRATIPLPLHIQPSTQKITTNTQTNIALSDINEIRPLHEEGPWNAQMPHIIPWYLYWWLIATLTLISFLITILTIKPYLFSTIINRFRKSSSKYGMARAKIKLAHQTKQYGTFYSIFVNILAARMGKEPSAITPENIQNILIQAGLSRDALNDWQKFFSQIAEISFYHPQYDQIFYNHLTENALYWIDVLEKLPGGER